MDVARADTVDAELDRLISKRASQDRRPDPDEQEELWKASVRRYNARRQEEMRRHGASTTRTRPPGTGPSSSR